MHLSDWKVLKKQQIGNILKMFLFNKTKHDKKIIEELTIFPTCKAHRKIELRLTRIESENIIILILLGIIIVLVH